MSSTEFQINTYTAGMQNHPLVASLGDGGFVVTWQSWGQDGAVSGVYGQRYGSTSNTVGSEFQINTYTENNQYNGSVTSLSDGGFVATWTSAGQDGPDQGGIYGQRYDSAGNTAGSEFQINTYTTDQQFSPSVTSLSDGGFVVTWTSDDQDGTGIFGQRFDAQGNKSGNFHEYSEFQINTYTANIHSFSKNLV